MSDIPATLKLILDGNNLVSNWTALHKMSGGAQAGAAVKANAYGLGAPDVVRQLQDAGCRDFYVANWQEALEIEPLVEPETSVSVLNGVRDEDMEAATLSRAKPVLNSLQQIKRWSGTGQPCDLMINSGMHRLGIDPEDLSAIDMNSLSIDMAMSHLASADEDCAQNLKQLDVFSNAISNVPAKRFSLANSAGIALGQDYCFDCTRPGLSLYGGVPRQEMTSLIQQVVFPQAQILQTRKLKAGDKVGYNAQYAAQRDMSIAILGIGYADGYLRGFSNTGMFRSEGINLRVLGRVSMDLIAIDISDASQLGEGDWVDCDFDLVRASNQSGLSQYELLTGLGRRSARIWH